MSDLLDLTIERPVAGGRMLARHDGRIVFVAGAIPGERVRARVERTTRQSVWAAVTEVLEPSPDRREPACDPACGGSVFAHVRYERQCDLKQQILVDAFRRLAHITLDSPPAVAASPERGYRLRAKLHAGPGRLGYYREGTHTICDAAPTSQMMPDSTRLAQVVFSALGSHAAVCDAVIVSENVAGSDRVLHLEWREGASIDEAASDVARLPASDLAGATGVTMMARGRLHTIVGRASVTDDAGSLFGGTSPLSKPVSWSRRAPAFFQANRYLVGGLVRCVLEQATGDRVIDLYAGVGLFSCALAARGGRVVAVEGERFAVEDLRANAEPWRDTLDVVAASVEREVSRPPVVMPDVVVLDPPRTGMSPEALTGLAAWRVPRLVYVSCDPPTLARDAAKLVAAGYRLASIDAFDLFPNTPHVETVAVFTGGR